MSSVDNLAFVKDDEYFQTVNKNQCINSESIIAVKEEIVDRDQWGKEIEFLFSCIALSVGLGNIWRFPFVALENGGGAFVIPYIIVLVLIGKPVYFMEMAMGQFSSASSVKVFNCVPVLRGIGVGQVISTAFVSTYYSSIMAITLSYFFDSFHAVLPWSTCKIEWTNCKASGFDFTNSSWDKDAKSSAELYFVREVIKENDDISNGIGFPIWSLFGFLVLTWSLVFIILVKGIKSAGKASYVLAIFPYVVLIVLLIRALTLDGAVNGIKYFFTPQWDKIFEPGVWYAAVTQVFFSLNIFFGTIVMYSSYNKFDHNVSRDANIVTALDTITSLLAGCCIFAIIGNLAHELGTDDIESVVKKGPGLAFISYPDAIAKFKFVPQLFSALFFLMLFLLGIGSLLAMTSCATTVIKDKFEHVENWQAALGFSIFGTLSGAVYLTPGGQSILQLVDFYGATFTAFILALGQLIVFCFIYGVNRVSKDIQFMLGFRPNIFWTVCWQFITPGLMTAIVIYTLWNFEIPRNGNQNYPDIALVIGWCLSAIGLLQVPIFAVFTIFFGKDKAKDDTIWKKVKTSFQPNSSWGPQLPETKRKYLTAIKEDSV